MSRHALLLLPLLLGCRYDLLPASRICDDLAYAVSERTLVCEDDEALANERYEAFVADTECLLSDKVEKEYNPDGILPADDDPEGDAELEALYDCVRAVRTADCERVKDQGDDPAFWLRQDPNCGRIVSAGGAQ